MDSSSSSSIIHLYKLFIPTTIRNSLGFFSLLQPFGFIASNLLGNKKHWTVWSRINWTVIYNVSADSLRVPDKTGLVLALGSIVELSTSGPPVNTGCLWSLTRSKGGASQAKRHRAWAGGSLWRFYGGSQSSRSIQVLLSKAVQSRTAGVFCVSWRCFTSSSMGASSKPLLTGKVRRLLSWGWSEPDHSQGPDGLNPLIHQEPVSRDSNHHGLRALTAGPRQLHLPAASAEPLLRSLWGKTACPSGNQVVTVWGELSEGQTHETL